MSLTAPVPVTAPQPCSTPACPHPAAFATRTAPSYCRACIDAAYQAGGLEPLEEFTSRRARRRARCLTCQVELAYPLDYVLEKNGYGERVCRVCFWQAWGAKQRAMAKTELDTALGLVLEHPERLTEQDRAVLAEHGSLRASMQRWWWPTERTRAAVDLLHHDRRRPAPP